MTRSRVWRSQVGALFAVVALTSAAFVPSLAAHHGNVTVVDDGAAARIESQFITLINDLRERRGLPSLTLDPSLRERTCEWTATMVAQGKLQHDPNLASDISWAEHSWTKGGENVGVGATVQSLFAAFVQSPRHLANLVEPVFNRLSVCVFLAPGRSLIYTTQRFVAVLPVYSPSSPAGGSSSF